MTAALVGHTGFVGGNLSAQLRFDARFNSMNIEEIAGRAFKLLVVSAMPAAMWMANRDPRTDRAILDRLLGCLRRARADQVVVMSTVAVYPNPVEVDESTPIDAQAQTPYGRHRWLLERTLAEHFPRVLAVRLPGLFGPGLKKNAVYDLLHQHETDKLHAESVYQLYNLERVWADVSKALDASLDVINFATEPLSLWEFARDAFELEFTNTPQSQPARFDVRSQNAPIYGGRDGYLYNRQQVLDDLCAFVRRERAAGAVT
jgi:nucleoside-diphosphate-sugar epimerase